jgi:hypothetical protein
MSKPQLTINSTDEFHIDIVSDGTVTVAEVRFRDTSDPFGGWTTVGKGQARRRKGDTRNERLAYRLAAVRALKEAVKGLSEGVEEYL